LCAGIICSLKLCYATTTTSEMQASEDDGHLFWCTIAPDVDELASLRHRGEFAAEHEYRGVDRDYRHSSSQSCF
jgi:hypothetical protein